MAQPAKAQIEFDILQKMKEDVNYLGLMFLNLFLIFIILFYNYF